MSIWAHAMGTAKSTIDRDNMVITLRSSRYPKKGYWEWVISGDTIVWNDMKRKGIVSETIHISSISEIELDLERLSGRLRITGNTPKLWARPISFSVPDVFVAYEAYLYILAKRTEGDQPPLKQKLSPVVVGVRQELDNGTLNKEELRAKGVHW